MQWRTILLLASALTAASLLRAQTLHPAPGGALENRFIRLWNSRRAAWA